MREYIMQKEEGNAPITVRELVRCKDCRYWGLTNFVHEPTGWCGRQETTRNPDWYCADGERKEKDNES